MNCDKKQIIEIFDFVYLLFVCDYLRFVHKFYEFSDRFYLSSICLIHFKFFLIFIKGLSKFAYILLELCYYESLAF